MKSKKDKSFKLLIVDDQAADIAGLNFLAQNLGLDVDLAFDGLQAWELAQKNKYNLIILDWHMPTMPGWVFLKRLEHRLMDPSISERFSDNIILHTGEPIKKEDFSIRVPFRILDIWQKPIDPAEIVRRIKNVRERLGA